MEDIYQNLARAAPQAAQSTTNMMPSPANPAQLGPAALFFMAAVRGGNLTQWLGDKAQEILSQSSKGKSLLNRLTQEGSVLSRMEAPGQEWRSIALPFYSDQEVHKLILHYKHEHADQNDQEAQKGKQTRFIFELTPSQMGPLQIDGLYRGQRLDVIIRSQDNFSAAMRQATSGSAAWSGSASRSTPASAPKRR